MSTRRCKECGCTWANACVHRRTYLTCTWADRDLCSACLEPDRDKLWKRPVRISNPKPSTSK